MASIKSKLKRILHQATSGGNFIGFDKYRNKGAFHWDEIEKNPDYLKLVNVISSFVKPQDTVLDIGCGDAAYLGKLSKLVKYAYGIDADKVAIKLGKEKLASNGIQNCSLHHLSIGSAKKYFSKTNPQSFDLIFSADVIEHLPRPEELLETAETLMSKKSTFLVGTPLFISYDLVSPYHIKEYTKVEISQLVNRFLPIKDELIIPYTRKDGVEYKEGYYFAICAKE